MEIRNMEIAERFALEMCKKDTEIARLTAELKGSAWVIKCTEAEAEVKRLREVRAVIDGAIGNEKMTLAREAWDYFKWMLEKTYGGPSPYLDRAIKALDAALSPAQGEVKREAADATKEDNR